MVDFDAVVLDPVYQTFGELAVLSIGPSSYDIVVIDNTKGVSVEDGSIAGMHTIRPAIDVRRSALVSHGITPAVLVGGQIVFATTAWRIKSVIENGIQLRLIVMQDD
jgi:hypothetical protein